VSKALVKNPELSYQEACEFFDYKENKIKFQNKIKKFEAAITKHCEENNNQELSNQITGQTEGAVTHNFADGQYIRQIVMPKNLLVSTKIHSKNHPFFIMKGEASIYSDKGVERIKAPFHGITEAGTKRVLYIHEECTFITVHRTDCLTIDEVVNEVTVDDFSKLELKGFDIEQIDRIMEKVL
jgi:ribosomal protein L31